MGTLIRRPRWWRRERRSLKRTCFSTCSSYPYRQFQHEVGHGLLSPIKMNQIIYLLLFISIFSSVLIQARRSEQKCPTHLSLKHGWVDIQDGKRLLFHCHPGYRLAPSHLKKLSCSQLTRWCTNKWTMCVNSILFQIAIYGTNLSQF